MILARDDIEKAVSWWAGKLLDHQPHSNGDDSFTSAIACFLADTMRQSVTLDQLNTFKAALAKSIEEYAKSIQAFGFPSGVITARAKCWPMLPLKQVSTKQTFRSKRQCFSRKKRGFWYGMATVPRLSGFVEVTEW